jgi:2-polyprenyl-3-methyl-5-hydroxy-6-metoxy-1,4-benzoquinol methylase
MLRCRHPGREVKSTDKSMVPPGASLYRRGMAYQHPLHYLLGLQGMALMRAYAGEHDRAFAEARVAEIRRLLDTPGLGAGVTAGRLDTVGGYAVWSRTYDEPGNGLFPYEEPFVHDIIDALPAGTALDAACGTGRHSGYLASRGHRVIGVDSSADMLRRARERVPDGEFHRGDLHRLPLPDDQVDLAVCALALAHLTDLRPAFAELARVLRPGGHLVVTDVHRENVALGSVPHVRTADGEPRLIAQSGHRVGDYLTAALPHGLEVRRCEEPRSKGSAPAPADEPPPADERSAPANQPPAAADERSAPANQRPAIVETGPWDSWPWSLLGITPAATAAAWSGVPAVVLLHFQKRDRPPRDLPPRDPEGESSTSERSR